MQLQAVLVRRGEEEVVVQHRVAVAEEGEVVQCLVAVVQAVAGQAVVVQAVAGQAAVVQAGVAQPAEEREG